MLRKICSILKKNQQLCTNISHSLGYKLCNHMELDPIVASSEYFMPHTSSLDFGLSMSYVGLCLAPGNQV